MRRTICGIVMGICAILIIGIVGGIDQGQPLSNAWWCIPNFIIMIAAGKIGGFFDEGR